MNHLLEYEAFNEKKQAGVIYHYTTIKGLIGILSEDRMASGHQHISFSRNPDLKQWYESYNAFCRIAFNGSNLTDKFHIEPYLFDPSKDPLFGGGTVSDPEMRRKYYRHEMEERVPKEEITGVKKYIIQVDILKSKIEYNSDISKLNKFLASDPSVKINFVDKFTPVRAIV